MLSFNANILNNMKKKIKNYGMASVFTKHHIQKNFEFQFYNRTETVYLESMNFDSADCISSVHRPNKCIRGDNLDLRMTQQENKCKKINVCAI